MIKRIFSCLIPSKRSLSALIGRVLPLVFGMLVLVGFTSPASALNPVTNPTDSFQKKTDGGTWVNTYVYTIETVGSEKRGLTDQGLTYDLDLQFERTEFAEFLIEAENPAKALRESERYRTTLPDRRQAVTEALEDIQKLHVRTDLVQVDVEDPALDLHEKKLTTVAMTMRIPEVGPKSKVSGGGFGVTFGQNSVKFHFDRTLTKAGAFSVRSVDFGPDGNLIAYGGNDNEVHVHETSGSWTEVQTLTKAGASRVRSVDFGPGGNLIAYGDNNGEVHVHETSGSWSEVQTLTKAGGFGVRSVDFGPDGNLIAYGDSSGEVHVHSINFTPVISPPVPDQSRAEDTDPWTVSLGSFGSNRDGDPLRWTATGADTLVESSFVKRRFVNAGRDTLILDPVSNANGTAPLTLLLTDGTDTTNQSLSVSLAPVNDAPIIDTPVADQMANEDGDSWAISLDDRARDVEGDSIQWRVQASESVVQAFLVEKAFHPQGADTLILDPIPRANGSGFVKLFAGDGSDTTSQFVRVTLGADSPLRQPVPITDPGRDLDILSFSFRTANLDVSIGGSNGQSAFVPGAVAPNDTVSVFVRRESLSSMDTLPWNPEYGFHSITDAQSVIDEADAQFFASSRNPVGDDIVVVSIWKNGTDTPANYLGSADTLAEDVRMTLWNVNYLGNPDDLQVAKLLGSTNEWKVVDEDPRVGGISGNYNVTFTVSSDPSVVGSDLSIFRLISGTGTSGSASETVVYPNPFKPNDGNPSTGEYGTGSGQGIHFGTPGGSGFPAGTTVKIYTIKGERIDSVTTTSGGLIQWNARTTGGEPVASGVYLYRIEVPDRGAKNGKLMIIR